MVKNTTTPLILVIQGECWGSGLSASRVQLKNKRHGSMKTKIIDILIIASAVLCGRVPIVFKWNGFADKTRKT